jgi:hypothetical protein
LTGVAGHGVLPPLAVAPAYARDVTPTNRPWRWTGLVTVPLELLAVVWSIPLVITLIMLPIGLAIAAALWLGRLILNAF